MQRHESLAIGTLIGERYRIVAPLARGGFGAVYVAEQIATERRVALKVLLPYLDGVSVDRLLTEARIPSRVNSEHIVQVIDAGIDPSSSAVFLVMELLAGFTLAELVRNTGPREPAEVAEYMRQIASGLDRAHGWLDRGGRPAPIIHRDLKPENVFLTQREDGTPLVKILDFGTAKILSQTTQVSGVLQGTPQYMAYEQAAGEPLTPATDIWSFGLIAFFLLTGRSFWLAVAREGAYAHLFGEVLTLPLPKASERARELGVGGSLTPEFDAWFARCVNRDVTQRFPSAGVAAVELGRALGAATRPSSRVPGRSRAKVALGGILLSGGVLAGVLIFVRASSITPTEGTPRNDPMPSPNRNPNAHSAKQTADAGEREPDLRGEPRAPTVTAVETPFEPSVSAPVASATALKPSRAADARSPRPRPPPPAQRSRPESPAPTPTPATRPHSQTVYDDR